MCPVEMEECCAGEKMARAVGDLETGFFPGNNRVVKTGG